MTKCTPKAAKRLHYCLSSDSDHSIWIENELESIKLSIDKIIKKDDIEKLITEIMGKLMTKMKSGIDLQLWGNKRGRDYQLRCSKR